MTVPMKGAFAGILGIIVLAAACTGSPSGPSPSTITPYTSLFTGTLAVGAVSSYFPAIPEASTVTIAVVSLTSGAVGAATPAIVGLAYGTTDENDPTICIRSNTVRVAPSLLTQLTVTSTAGSHCVDLFDAGTLRNNVTFAVRVTVTPVSYKPSPPAAAAGTETFSSNLPVSSSVSRTFTASQAGPVSITLTSASPPAGVVVGLGLGVPRADGSGCFAYTSLNTTAGSAAQITSPVEPGQYCVRVYDPGTLPNLVNFTVTAAHP
jgi:hypothetical protein